MEQVEANVPTMAVEATGNTISELYSEALQKMRTYGKLEDSRNGQVITIPVPTILCLTDPRARVLFDPIRDCNPFFHAMEVVWMMAGNRRAEWICQFNSNIENYTTEDALGKYFYGAYGDRWQFHFNINQILEVIRLLRLDWTTRRAVIAMWDPMSDLRENSDLPCNTHIYFRCEFGSQLDMTVCNRSNDMIWGALGANVVHMTYLHELIATACNMQTRNYRVFSQNMHMYRQMPRFHEIFNTINAKDSDQYPNHLLLMPIIQPDEAVPEFLYECEKFITNINYNFQNEWLEEVAKPIYMAYMARKKEQSDGMNFVRGIGADDWRIACQEWIARRIS